MFGGAAELCRRIGRCRQIASCTVSLSDPFLQRRRRLEEHVRELRPGDRRKQHRGVDEKKRREDGGPKGVARMLQPGPDEAEGRAQHQRDDEQIGAHEAER